MMRTLSIIGLFCTGCLVVPATKTTTRSAGTERSQLRVGRIVEVTLAGTASESAVRVEATSKRECHREVFAVTEVTTSRTARLGGAEDPRAQVFGLLLAPVTIPLSALATGFVVAFDADETTRRSTPSGTETVACTTPAANLALTLMFPSGVVHHARTDDRGALELAIPGDEPYSGRVTVRGTSSHAVVDYEQPRPPIAVARDAVIACRAQHQVEATTLKLTIDHRGAATRVSLSAGDAQFHACVSTKIAGLAFPAPLRGNIVVLPFEHPSS